MGNNVKVSRVKAVNWGTKTVSKTCYAIAVITADRGAGVTEVTNAGIEGCIAVQPDSSVANVGPAVALHAGGKEDGASNAEAYGKGPYIRSCFVDCGSPTAAAEFRGLSMGWCRGGVVEGNQVYNTQYGGPYQDKASSRDLIVRNNLYRNVRKGPFWNLGVLNPSTPAALISLSQDLAYDSTGKTALAKTSGAHSLQLGERVKIDFTSGSAAFKGIFVIKDVPATDQFHYAIAAAPGLANPGGPTMQKVLGIGNLLVELNTIELAAGTADFIGIHLKDKDTNAAPQPPDYPHGDVVVRGNKIRYLDGLSGSSYQGTGIEIDGAKNLTISENVVDCAPANPVKNFRSGTVAYFHNTNALGKLIQGLNGETNSKYSELETEAEDNLVLTSL